MAVVVKETPDQAKKRKEREALILLFLLLVSDTDSHLCTLVKSYLAGSISVHSLSAQFTSALFGAHVQATYYGRRMAGVGQPLGDADATFARTVMAEQSPHITALMNDLSASKYPIGPDGELQGDLAARLKLWARRLRGTANDAWRLSLDPDTLLWWVMEPGLQHCEDCPRYAARSPRRAADWDVQPGSADCQCGSNCGCQFKDADGYAGFPRDGRDG